VGLICISLTTNNAERLFCLCDYLPSPYVFLDEVSVQIFCSFKKTGLFLVLYFKSPSHSPCQICNLQILLPHLWFVFSFF
jgi:hypothetical protein